MDSITNLNKWRCSLWHCRAWAVYQQPVFNRVAAIEGAKRIEHVTETVCIDIGNLQLVHLREIDHSANK